MYELRAEFDSERRIVRREDAPADAASGLEAADAKARGNQILRGGEAGSPGADDGYVVGIVHSIPSSLRRARRGVASH